MTVKDILQIGAQMELESYNFYIQSAEKSEYPGGKRLLTKLASDEEKHRNYFLKALEDPASIAPRIDNTTVTDLKLTDNLVDVPLDPKADFSQILKFAAQREKVAHDFYLQVAEQFKGTDLGNMLHNFALEELRHKKLLEDEYDEITGW